MRLLSTYARTNLIDIFYTRLTMVVSFDRSCNTYFFRGIDYNNLIAEYIKTGLIENSGFEKGER